MRPSAILAVLLLAIGTQTALAQSAQCPTERKIVYVRKGVNDNPAAVIAAVSAPNTMVLLAPDVDIDFSNWACPSGPEPNAECPNGTETPLIVLKRCVTLASYAPATNTVFSARFAETSGVAVGAASAPKTAAARSGLSPALTNIEIEPVAGSGRTPHSLGPVLRYGTNAKRSSGATFIEMPCPGDPLDPNSGDGARILGFRVFGPNFADHHTSEIGINIRGCHDVEIANMEVAGWGGSAIRVDDSDHFKDIPTQEPSVLFIRIHDNYVHHNQHSTSDHTSLGYGVVVSTGAFAQIYQNVFDYNKHSITAAGKAGGYNALYNLILKGGGFQDSFFERDIHVVDAHGTDSCPNISDPEGIVGGAGAGAGLGVVIGGLIGGPPGAIIGGIVGGILGGLGGYYGAEASHHIFNCGDAGFHFEILWNTFQYSKTTDIKIRGKPKDNDHPTVISANIFARGSKDDAIQLQTTDNVNITGSNFYGDDTFGQYGVCDIDGDGIDDLILMTGVSWWFSSAGQYPWSFLKADTAVLKDVQLGDFDGDGRCDVIKDSGAGHWMLASGGTADWKPFGYYLAPLNEVRFGRFDPARPDLNRGIRPPTHAFWRNDEGFWFVTPLSQPNGWTLVQSSGFPLADLRFGDFTGDGVTDVLGNEGGHWAISDAARGSWSNLNPTLNDPVKNSNIFIANMDATDNVDDVLRLDVPVTGIQGTTTLTATWQRSSNGTTPWSTWKGYSFTVDGSNIEDYVGLGFGFVGQFRGAPGASTLTIDPNRIGHFFSPAQGRDRQEWTSLFWY
jgi:Right handed beta helix region